MIKCTRGWEGEKVGMPNGRGLKSMCIQRLVCLVVMVKEAAAGPVDLGLHRPHRPDLGRGLAVVVRQGPPPVGRVDDVGNVLLSGYGSALSVTPSAEVRASASRGLTTALELEDRVSQRSNAASGFEGRKTVPTSLPVAPVVTSLSTRPGSVAGRIAAVHP